MVVPTLPYEIDLSGPPARLPPRASPWAISAFSLGASVPVVVLEGLLIPGVGATSLPTAILLLFSITVAQIYAIWYATLRLTGGGIALGLVVFLGPFVVFGFRPTREAGRRADREEVLARRRLRQGGISRREYERVIAYRHFVHGEISRAEYHAVLWYLDYPIPRSVMEISS